MVNLLLATFKIQLTYINLCDIYWVASNLDLAIVPIMEHNKTIKLRGATNDWIYDSK